MQFHIRQDMVDIKHDYDPKHGYFLSLECVNQLEDQLIPGFQTMPNLL